MGFFFAFVGVFTVRQEGQVIVNGALTRLQLFLFGAGQEAQVFAYGHNGAADHHAAVGVFVHGALQARGQRQQGFAGARGADQRDNV